MARIRTIKPSFFTSLTIADLTPEQRLTFIGLWTHADDEGRCVYDARLIRAALWPLDDRTTADVADDVRAITELSLITRYEVGGREYLAINGWANHQKINRPTPSDLPGQHEGSNDDENRGMTGENDMPEDSLSTHEEFTAGKERKGKERKGKEGRGAGPDEARPDVEQICELLADLIESNGSKRPSITKGWRDAARLMLDRDGRTLADIEAGLRWCQADSFWKGNILSLPKFREKFDQLRLAAGRQSGSGPRDRQGEILQREMAAARAADALELRAIGGRA